jgi:hypothetical protein
MQELAQKLQDPRLSLLCQQLIVSKNRHSVFITYVAVVIIVTIVLIVYAAPRYGHTNILVYIAVCSLVGSLSVISVKGLGLAIKETITKQEQFTNWLVCPLPHKHKHKNSPLNILGSLGFGCWRYSHAFPFNLFI